QSFLISLALIGTDSVAFEPGSSSFATGSGAALLKLARLLTAFPSRRIRIEGHTDNTGPESVNLRLSRERAEAVASFLSSRGVADNRLIAKGYGSTQPIDDNFTDAGRARNRRIEISYLD
ncbi:MAG: OOP family OmpA-OmpF porin, partial [Granulosicoccus sp.]